MGTSRHHNAVRLKVTDTGAGLTPEESKHLFTPYYTTKQHGTGLGSAIVQSVVSDHNGTIGVESEPGAGTTIRVDVPIAPPSTLQLEAIGKISALSPVQARAQLPSGSEELAPGEAEHPGSAAAPAEPEEPGEKITALSPVLPRKPLVAEHESEILGTVAAQESELYDADIRGYLKVLASRLRNHRIVPSERKTKLRDESARFDHRRRRQHPGVGGPRVSSGRP